MKTGTQLTLLGVAAFIVFLIISAPAAILTSTIEQFSKVRFQSVSGTLWNGGARGIKAPSITTDIGPVRWNIKPLSLLLGRLSLDIELGSMSPLTHLRGNASISASLFGTVKIRDAAFSADADWVFTQAVLPIAGDGVVELNIEHLHTDRKQPLPEIKGALHWRNAAVNYPQFYSLGEYQVQLAHRPEDGALDHIEGRISDINSPLKISGTLLLYTSYRYILDIDISTTPGAPGDIKRMLPLLGSPKPDGSINIRRQGLLQEL
jgi:hypothetical protein